jgi:F0F1-type ATP synthase assembly protein I
MKIDKNYFKHLQIGIELAVFVLIGFYAGHKADRHFGTSPWLVLAGSFAGMCFGFYIILKRLLKDK